MIQAALPQLIEAGGGSIVCVGTRAALQPFPGAAGYIASKAAVIAFAHAVAVEYRDDGVRCNAILPERDRHAGQPRVDAERRPRPVGQAGRDRRRDRAPALRGLRAHQRRGDPGVRPGLGNLAN